MKNITFIVLFQISDTTDSGKLAESIENSHFEITTNAVDESIYASKIREEIIKELDLRFDYDKQMIDVYPITDFMDAFNNEEINDSLYFMSYVIGTIINLELSN